MGDLNLKKSLKKISDLNQWFKSLIFLKNDFFDFFDSWFKKKWNVLTKKSAFFNLTNIILKKYIWNHRWENRTNHVYDICRLKHGVIAEISWVFAGRRITNLFKAMKFDSIALFPISYCVRYVLKSSILISCRKYWN